MQQIREFRSNFENISRDCRATFVRVSHDFPVNLTYFHLNLYDSRTTFIRMSLSFIFSPNSGEVFARLACDRRASVAKISHCKFAKLSRRQVRDTCTNVA